MKYQKTIFLLAGILFSVLTANAQNGWTLDSCIEYAHKNNLQIKQAELDAEIASNNHFRAKMQILPDLNASANRNFYFGHTIDYNTNEFITENTTSDNFTINSSVYLFNGLQTYNSIKANEFTALSKVYDVDREKVNITLQIANAYLIILLNQELLEAAKNQKGITSMQVERTSKLVEAGSTARGDLLEIMAQLASENLNVTNAKNELNLAYLNLTQLLDIDSVTGFDIYYPDSIELDISVPIDNAYSIYEGAITYLPHIKSAEYTLKSNERYLSIQKGKLSPNLTLGGRIGSGYSSADENSYREQFDNRSYRSIYFQLNVPIFNKWQTKTDISNAKINVLQSETSLDLTKQQLYKEIQQAYNDAVSAKERYISAKEAVESYREAFNYTEQKFNVGIVNSVEYSIAKNNFTKAESDLLKAKYEYLFSTKILDFYRGTQITL